MTATTWVRILGLAIAVLSAVPQAPAQAPAARERGIGPFRMETARRGTLTVRLLRREKSLVWVDLLSSSGQYIETGIDTGEITRLEFPRPAVLDTAEQAATTDQVAQASASLRKITDALMPYRDLPGLPVDEALYLQGRLHEKRGAWLAALAVYDDLARQPYAPGQAAAAGLRAGICCVRLDRMEEALRRLDKAPIPDDDVGLLSDAYFARAQARAGAGRHEEALMDYLHLVVFFPFAQSNEVRALAAALPSYAAMDEWGAVWKTVASLKDDYPDAAETAQALEWVKPYEEKLVRESEYQAPVKSETGEEP